MTTGTTAIRIARIRTGKNLRDFARQHGLSESTLCRAERGIGYVPPAWRPVLARALNVTEDALVDERGFPKLDEVEQA